VKILNLFAGIGGNRSLWGDDHKITAVEIDERIISDYHDRFPTDTISITDAYEYLENWMDNFEFIWASPPCVSHSRLNVTCQNMRIPDLRLYGMIIFLDRFCKGKWVVENVIPYYNPLIPWNVRLGRHVFWCNFNIPEKKFPQPKGTLKDLPIDQLQAWYNIFSTKNRKLLRNCVDYRIGKYILDCAVKEKQKSLTEYV
jgi:DNA (cytosine-5)-methyltransferase 1